MYILGRTQPLDRYAIIECLGVIQRLGFDGVEICLENPDIDPDLLDDDLAARVRERVHALGLAPYSVSYHKDYIFDDEELRRTLAAIRWTRALGSDVFVFAGTRKRTGDTDEWARLVRRTRELVRAAEEIGVTLAEEFEPDFIVGCTAELLRLFEAIPSPHLAANLDLGHMFLCDPDPIGAIGQVGARAVHAHVENMRTGVHDHMVPQEGDMVLADYINALAQTGFDGGLALDLYKYDYEQVAPGAIAHLRALIAAAEGISSTAE